jgi:hypothetical protein
LSELRLDELLEWRIIPQRLEIRIAMDRNVEAESLRERFPEQRYRLIALAED